MSHTNPFASIQLRSVEDVDNAARFLSAQWERSFSPAPKLDGKKKSKLRDMVCNLAGYQNGFRSFLATLSEDAIPEPREHFDLPDQIIVTGLYDLSYMYVGSDTAMLTERRGDPELLNWQHPSCLATLYFDINGYNETPDGFSLEEHLTPLREKPLWQYIVKHYRIEDLTVITPRIDKYGVSPLALPDGAAEFAQNLYFDIGIEEAHRCLNTIDRGDDGCDTFALLLSRQQPGAES